MNRIEQLISEMCPDGVEFRELGEISQLVRGNGMPKSDFSEIGVGAIHYGQIYTYYGAWATKTLSFVKPEIAKKLAKVDCGDIITNTSENLDDVCKAVAWLGENKIVTGGHATVIKHKENPKFLSYWLQTEDFTIQKKKLATGTKVIDVSARNLSKIKIPVPPIVIQNEIVKILDKFLELQARKTQYNYYRNKLFTYKDGKVIWRRLGEVATFTYGLTAKAENSGQYRFIRITDIDEHGKLSVSSPKYISPNNDVSEYFAQCGDILMARTGATFGKTLLVSDNVPSVYASFLIRIKLDESQVLPGYYWHFAQSECYWRQANRLVSKGGGRQQFNGNALKLIQVAIPSLDEQSRIISVLDKFDALVNDLTYGLPAEIKLRRIQYEYYRNKLLTFKEKPTALLTSAA